MLARVRRVVEAPFLLMFLVLPAHVLTDQCSYVEVTRQWSTGYKALLQIKMDEAVTGWTVGVEFSGGIISFEVSALVL